MRTTLVIQDELLAAAKKRAADRKSNVSAIVNEALRAALKSDVTGSPQTMFQMPTFRPQAEAGRTDSKPAELFDLMVAEDLGEYRP